MAKRRPAKVVRPAPGRSTPRGRSAAKPAPPKPKKTASRGRSAAAGKAAPGKGRVILGIGQVTVDLIAVAPRGTDSRVELTEFSIQGGGATGTALATIAALGGKARWFGRLSDDEFGHIAHRALRGFGVDLGPMLIESGKVSPVSIISIDRQTRRRTVQFTRGDTTALVASDLPPRLLDGVGMLFIDGHCPAVQIPAAEQARARGIPVFLHASQLHHGIGELFALADVLIASERLTADVAPASEIEDSLVELSRMGPRTVVVTLGSEGAVAVEGDKLIRQAIVDVEVVDTTGAGDVFAGAFAQATLEGWPIERALPFAAAAAGLKCGSLGGQAGIPARADVLTAAGLG